LKTFLILTLLMAPLASAATLYSNGVPDLVDGWFSDTDAGKVQLDTLSLSSPGTVRSVQWWGGYCCAGGQSADTFTIQFYSDVAGVPGAVFQTYAVAPTLVDTGNTVAGFEVFQYTADVPDTLLSAGNYWISIFNDTTADPANNWFWATSAQTGTSYEIDGGGAPILNGVSLAFNLADTSSPSVPEPSTLLLSGLGLAAVAGLRRRHSA